MKIEDNFLEQEKFDKLQQLMMGSYLPWFYNDCIDSPDDVDKFQFTHSFYKRGAPQFSFKNEFIHILDNCVCHFSPSICSLSNGYA